MAKDRSSRDLVVVVEALNETLRERFVGVTDLAPAQLGERPPHPVVSYWRPEHSIRYRCLAYAVPLSDVPTLIARHVGGSGLSSGWKDVVAAAL